MPQLLVIALAGAGLYAGYRWLSHTLAQMDREAELATQRVRARSTTDLVRDLGPLELDPATGIYRPVRRDR